MMYFGGDFYSIGHEQEALKNLIKHRSKFITYYYLDESGLKSKN